MTETNVRRGEYAKSERTRRDIIAAAVEVFSESGYRDGALRDVARKWPTEEGFADEAFFQIGESYFQEKKYRPALQEYIKVVEKFPKGQWVDDDFFRIGLCSTELGNLEDALIFFDEIVNNHPKSPLVKTAKKKVKEIRDRLEAEKGTGGAKP
mgnify:CR=1 FL=1